MEMNKHGMIKDRYKKLIKDRQYKSNLPLIIGAAIIFLLVFCGGLFLIFRPYTISFDLNDGSDIIYATYDINDGVIHLGIPTREGFRFTGWTGSNGSDPVQDVTVGNGNIGNLHYKANWSEELFYTCQDWVIDNEGNPVKEITSEVDSFLMDGKSIKDYKAVDRTQKAQKGTTVNAATWGDDGSYSAYSIEYVFVGTSGDVQIDNDGMIVYRYFYPVLDVNYVLDGERPSSSGLNDMDVARFDLVVDGKKVASNVSDYCTGVAIGASYEIVVKEVNTRFEYKASNTELGIMGDKRNNVSLSFVTRKEGEVRVTCQDWVIDAKGRRIREITDHVDQLLSEGKNNGKYPVQERTITVDKGEVISGELWGKDPSVGAYANGYAYVGASKPITINRDNIVVYRYFYPVLDIGAFVDGQNKVNTEDLGKFNVYIDEELVAENVNDFFQGVPAGSSYRIEITEYENFEYMHPDMATDSGIMHYVKRNLFLRFETRTGTEYVILEDWIVDAEGNRIREITDEVDAYLSSDSNKGVNKRQSRILKAEAGTAIDAGLFGNDEDRGAYSMNYMYVSSSGKSVVLAGGIKIYRYFWPVLDVNGVIDGQQSTNTADVAIFNVYVDGVLTKINTADFCQGVPVNSQYEISMVRPQNDYKYTEDEFSTGLMPDEFTAVRLTLDKDE